VINAIGDSHAEMTFAGIPGVVTHHLGPRTMYRAGRPGDELLVEAARGIPLTVDDVVILCFGEIDCRCHVHVQAALPGRSLDEVVQTLADRYLDRVVSLDVHGARVGVLSATPPTTAARTAGNPDFPVAGTDAQRAAYTRQLNLRLQVGCSRRGLLYVDTHSQYQDENGMLDVALADWNVHIKDTQRVEEVLRRMGLL